MAITIKQRKFVDNIMKGMPRAVAALQAGYRGGNYCNELMTNPSVKSLLLKKLEKWELNEDLIAKKIKDGLNARTVPQKDGGHRYDDQFTRKQFLDLLIKIRGDYAPEKIEATERHIQIIIDGNMVRALLDSKVVKPEELETIEGECISSEVIDGKLDSGSNQEARGTAQGVGNTQGEEDSIENPGSGDPQRGQIGETSTLGGNPAGICESKKEIQVNESQIQPQG